MNNLKVTEKNELAYNYFQKLKSVLRQQGVLFLETGRLLKILRDEELYQYIGEGYDTWTGFLGDPDIGISQSRAYAYMGIYEIFIMRYGLEMDSLASIPWDKLRLALPEARRAGSKEKAIQIVERTRSLSRSDLKVEFGQEKDEKGEQKTKTVKMVRCKDCGGWRFVDFDIKDLCKCEK